MSMHVKKKEKKERGQILPVENKSRASFCVTTAQDAQAMKQVFLFLFFLSFHSTQRTNAT